MVNGDGRTTWADRERRSVNGVGLIELAVSLPLLTPSPSSAARLCGVSSERPTEEN